jgi:murein DD-endopeptidase MepM/ murein hydrolase activator NlpD
VKFLKEKLNSLIEKIAPVFKKLCHIFRYSRIALATLVLVFSVAATSLFAGLTIAYNIEYNGSVIAQVKDKKAYDEAVNIAKTMVTSCCFEEYAYTPEFHITVTTEKNLATPNDIAISIMEKTDSIGNGTALKIDGEIFASVSADCNLNDYIKNYLANYVQGEDVKSSFLQKVECVNGYYPDNTFASFEVVKEKIAQLDVKTVQTLHTTETIPFTTATRTSSERGTSYYQKIVTGVNGVKECVKEVTMVNGEVTDSFTIYEEVITQPVQEVFLKGTKPEYSSSGVTYASELGCIWPLKRVSGQMVSAYYGDGRNHKGIDIASPAGTPIYAAQAGTVIVSQRSSSYGYYIVIEHANGYKTYYAHCSRLIAKVGQRVAQGQHIADVGSTGQSTGNHLHFEVRKNNVCLNPEPFLGL